MADYEVAQCFKMDCDAGKEHFLCFYLQKLIFWEKLFFILLFKPGQRLN